MEIGFHLLWIEKTSCSLIKPETSPAVIPTITRRVRVGQLARSDGIADRRFAHVD